MLKSTMLASNVDLGLCFDSPGPTGQAVILLQPSGENSIVLVPGANADWPASWKDSLLPAVAAADLVSCSDIDDLDDAQL
jgi:ribokinase